MEFAKDNASYLNNENATSISEKTTNQHTTSTTNSDGGTFDTKQADVSNIRPPITCKLNKNINSHSTTETRRTQLVTKEMAPSIDADKTPLVDSQKSPAANDKPKEKKRKEKPKDEVTFRTHLTSLAHVSVLVFVYMIIKLALTGEFVFFTWHPILMSVGWMLMMTEGFYAINKYNTYWRFKTKGGFRVKVHVTLLAIGYILSITGFIIVYINKDLNGKPHFVSWHGLFGLIGILCTLPPVINGTVLWYKKELERWIAHPRLLKFVHVLSGCLAFLFGAASLVLSVYTRWFGKKTNKEEYIFYIALASVVYPLFWAIYGPSVKLVRAISEYFSEEKED